MIYLNNAATSFPKPPEVVKAVSEYMGSVPFHCLRTGFIPRLRSFRQAGQAGQEGGEEDVISACRQKLADLFNAEDASDIIFTSGATEALNLAIRGLDLKGGHVVTTLIEHNSVLRPLRRLEKAGDIELSIVGCDQAGYVNPENIAKNIKSNTKAVVINHASNVTGKVQDLKTISGITSSFGALFIVDASQSAGCIPIDVKADKIDILAFTGHKSLFSMPGIGGMYLGKGLRLEPLKTGGTGEQSELEDQPDEVPLRYEAGTPNIPGIVSLGAGVDFINKTGLSKIRDRKYEQYEKIIGELEEEPCVEIIGRKGLDGKIPMVCFNVKNIPSNEIGGILEDSFGIVVRSELHCAPLMHKGLGTFPDGAIRVSPSYFTKDEEIDKFVYAIKQICEATFKGGVE